MWFQGPKTWENGSGMRMPWKRPTEKKIGVLEVAALLIALGPLMKPPKLN